MTFVTPYMFGVSLFYLDMDCVSFFLRELAKHPFVYLVYILFIYLFSVVVFFSCTTLRPDELLFHIYHTHYILGFFSSLLFFILPYIYFLYTRTYIVSVFFYFMFFFGCSLSMCTFFYFVQFYIFVCCTECGVSLDTCLYISVNRGTYQIHHTNSHFCHKCHITL